MVKAVKSRSVACISILTFILFFSTIFLAAQPEGKGKFFGIIYSKDIVPSLEGAVFKLRNISTGVIHESSVDRLGTFKIEGLDAGLYKISLSTIEGDFILESLFDIKADETALASFSLTPQFQLVKTEVEVELIGKGNLAGVIYEQDGVTPTVGAIVKIRNLFTGVAYDSGKTDSLGTFKIDGIDEGLYSGGIVTDKGNFNIENFIGIKANEKAKVTFLLRPDVTGEVKKAELKTTVIEKVRLVRETKKFFSSATGIAIIAATSAVVTYGIVKLVEKKEEVSPFK